MSRLTALGGTTDLLPEATARWSAVESRARALLAQYGYQEVRTPLLENAEVFERSLGDATEIVQKQMYRFTDRGGRAVALRPEGTASTVRCYLEHGLDKTGGFVKWYYVGPMFRAERPQKGRSRQFHQLGVEVFGTASPLQDAEVMALLMHLLRTLGLTNAVLKVNNLGCRDDRPKMLAHLRAYFTTHQQALCDECRARLATNPLRILDCKQARCRAVAQGAGGASSWACAPCQQHLRETLAALDAATVKYERDDRLVRGLDYYTKTAFEVTHPGLGAQDAVGGGGRYDELVEQMGGPSVPAVGFAVGLERLILALEAEQVPSVAPPAPSVCVATMGVAAQTKGFELVQALRQAGIASVGDYDGRPLKRQLEQANKLGCPLVLVIGDEELAKQVVTVRDMQTRQQAQVTWEGCVDDVRRRLQNRPSADRP